ncbi:Hpt domain-containing protein [Myxococcus sp. MxC21-1]|nr:Hpt domain-containing protein [Myxococcus sp. MxC21-1]
MSRYLGLFISEATDHLEALGRDLVELEREGSSSAVDSMFRHAHSVKGMASSMGFEPIAIVAHRVEDLVDAVRQDRGRLDRDLVDLLLTAADTMLAQVRAVAEGKPPDDSAALLTQLSQRVTTMTGQAPAATRVAKVTALKPEGGGSDGTGSDGPGGGTGSGSDGSGTGAARAELAAQARAAQQEVQRALRAELAARAPQAPVPTLPQHTVAELLAAAPGAASTEARAPRVAVPAQAWPAAPVLTVRGPARSAPIF